MDAYKVRQGEYILEICCQCSAIVTIRKNLQSLSQVKCSYHAHTHTHTQETKILYQNGKAKFVTDAWRSSCLNGKLSEGEMSPSILKKSFFSTSDLRKHLRSATMLQIRSLTIILLIGMTFESPLDSQSVNQSILKEINLEYLLKGLMLKLQYLGYQMQRAQSLEKTLMLERLRAGGVKGDRG